LKFLQSYFASNIIEEDIVFVHKAERALDLW
jgi:hypothetical protein